MLWWSLHEKFSSSAAIGWAKIFLETKYFPREYTRDTAKASTAVWWCWAASLRARKSPKHLLNRACWLLSKYAWNQRKKKTEEEEKWEGNQSKLLVFAFDCGIGERWALFWMTKPLQNVFLWGWRRRRRRCEITQCTLPLRNDSHTRAAGSRWCSEERAAQTKMKGE